MLKKLLKIFLDPAPLQALALKIVTKYQLGSYAQRAKIGALKSYPHYGYALYNAAKLAKRLGHNHISTMEFGVAGGNGLIALEERAKEIEKELSIKIDVYGFDSAQGLPQPIDYRDIPFYWKPAFFKMDVQKLQQRLSRAKLILGDVHDTLNTFIADQHPAPIAAIMFDLDYYSATKAALQIFHTDERYMLPRVFCYFDDIMGSEECPISENTGQRLAINEFNDTNEFKKLDKLHFLEGRRIINAKYNRLRMFHNFKHSQYNTFVGPENQQQNI